MSEQTPYFPASARKVGDGAPPDALLAIYGPGGSGKSHLLKQMLAAEGYGPDECFFIVSEDVTSIYGPGARYAVVDDYKGAVEIAKDLLTQARAGRRLPKLIGVDSASGLALGTQAYYREHPVMVYNEKTREYVPNKFEGFAQVGNGFLDLMLLLQKIPGTKVVLCTTFENPTKPGAPPEFAVEGNMIPKFFVQMTTAALYLRKVAFEVGREEAEKANEAGTLLQPHRIVVPWKPEQATVQIIDRFLHSEGGGEVICKGHHALGVKEKANLPEIVRKIVGKV